MNRVLKQLPLHLALAAFAVATLVPFVFVINNSFRTNSEQYHTFFGLPEAFKGIAANI